MSDVIEGIEIPAESLGEILCRLSVETDTLECAAVMMAGGRGDELVVLPFGTEVPGVQHDDGMTAIAAIDLIRALVASYGENEI